jgi:hypothetical protein
MQGDLARRWPCEKRSTLFSAFPMFVPSLSWQNDRFLYINGIAKSGVFRTVAVHHPTQDHSVLQGKAWHGMAWWYAHADDTAT